MTSDSPWKRLFAAGGFAWSFRMRPGNAREFFASREPGLLEEKRRTLEEHPDRHVMAVPGSGPLVGAAFEQAVSWGHVAADGSRDLMRLAREWEPDLLLVDGESLKLVAGSVSMPSSWELGHAIGKPVHQVHEMVPRLNPSIGEQIGRFLKQIPEGKSFLRENWSLTRTADRNYHPALGRPKLDAQSRPADLFLRLERQLFTSIPGGVMMGLRIETHPLEDLRSDPEVWGNLAEIIRSMPDDVADYKSMLAARDALAEAMSGSGG